MMRVRNSSLGSTALYGAAHGAAALSLALLAVPALADVRAGVDAWSRGDYAAAVTNWEGPAAAGDADAMFNLAQAYRLGRGVAQDEARAEELYFRAAQAGHVQAADTYGLLLFQAGRRDDALPFVEDAARRGDPRSQYLLGIAHFNGDLVPRDWVRAYALMTLANSSGLPQAAPAIAQMDSHIPLADRQAAAGLAETMRAEAFSARTTELAAADLAMGANASSVAEPQPRVPRPLATVAVSPSWVAARTAIEEAREATGTESPAAAGAGFARTPAAVAAAPAAPPAPARVSAPAPAQQVAASGPWRVQLGAFSVRANAERLWQSLSSRPELAGREWLMLASGSVVRLQAGGFASQADAQAACNALRRAGQDCLVTRN